MERTHWLDSVSLLLKMMAYRETGYTEPTIAECLSYIPGNNINESDESSRKPSPSGSIMSERGMFEVNFKRDDCITDSVRSSLSGQSDICSSPPMKQQLPTSNGTLPAYRLKSFNSRANHTNSLGHMMEVSQHISYAKSHTTNNRHKSGYIQQSNSIKKLSDHSYNNLYNDPSAYVGHYGNVTNYDQVPIVNNQFDSMSPSIYAHSMNYQNNEFFYGSHPTHDADPAAYMGKAPINEYVNHQGSHVNPSSMFHGSNHAIRTPVPAKDARDALCQDFSWMRDKKSGKKVHDSRREFIM